MNEEPAKYRVHKPLKFNHELGRVDLRRTWLVVGAIDALERPTITSISHQLGFGKSTVQRIVELLERDELIGFEIEVTSAVMTIQSWGVLSPEIIRAFYNEYLIVRQ